MSIVTSEKLQSFAEKLAAKIESLFVKKESGKGLSTNDYTTTEKSKLAGIAAGAEVNVQADWAETSTSSDAYIKNKPDVLEQDDISAWAKSATKPTYTFSEIGSKPTTLSGYGITDAAAKMHTHTGDDITSLPASKITGTISPDNLPESGPVSISWANVSGKPSTFPPAAHTHTMSDITDYEEITDDEIDDIIAGVFTS